MSDRRTSRRRIPALLLGVIGGLTTITAGQAGDGPEVVTPRPILDDLRAQATALQPVMTTDLGRAFVRAVDALPEIDAPRIVFWNRGTGRALGEAAYDALEPAARDGYERLELDARFYYLTRYGSPLAYARAIDLAGANGVSSLDGARVADFGFGGIGHLQMLAGLGADVVGTEVYDLLRELYADPGDVGTMPGSPAAGVDGGSITLAFGRFPAEAPITEAVGTSCRLFLSKNTLKRGYIHPEREVDPRMLIDLGVDDATFLRATFDALEPGGLMVVYNIYPRPGGPDEPYLPWASGEFPFERAATEATGFEVVQWNVDDSEAMREMATRLGWGERMDLDDVLAMVTIIRRPTVDPASAGD